MKAGQNNNYKLKRPEGEILCSFGLNNKKIILAYHNMTVYPIALDYCWVWAPMYTNHLNNGVHYFWGLHCRLLNLQTSILYFRLMWNCDLKKEEKKSYYKIIQKIWHFFFLNYPNVDKEEVQTLEVWVSIVSIPTDWPVIQKKKRFISFFFSNKDRNWDL